MLLPLPVYFARDSSKPLTNLNGTTKIPTCIRYAIRCAILLSICLTGTYQANFKDLNLRDIARQKVASRKKEKEGTPEQPKYRDRASERRTLFNQPDAPMPEKDVKKRDTPSRAPTPPPVPPANPGQDGSNVGNKLLKMMGWKEGTGLGSEGDGRVNPMFVSLSSSFACSSTHLIIRLIAKPPYTRQVLVWVPAKEKT